MKAQGGGVEQIQRDMVLLFGRSIVRLSAFVMTIAFQWLFPSLFPAAMEKQE